jgi:hypothetical protein
MEISNCCALKIIVWYAMWIIFTSVYSIIYDDTAKESVFRFLFMFIIITVSYYFLYLK